jgi:RNase H-fold protein (predicted Holliday junction resolvase)
VEGELLSSSSSAESSSKSRTYTEVMEEQFPYYLDAGMTPHQYWDEDVTLVKAYRQVMERRREWQNQMLWLQGLYFYKALDAVMPALSIKTKGIQIDPYVKEPYPLTEKQVREQQERAEAEKFQEQMAYMKERMTAINARFAMKESEVKADG